MLHTLAEAGCTTGPPTPEVVADGKQTFMTVRERAIGDLGPSPARKCERRSVLNRTLDQSAVVAERGG